MTGRAKFVSTRSFHFQRCMVEAAPLHGGRVPWWACRYWFKHATALANYAAIREGYFDAP